MALASCQRRADFSKPLGARFKGERLDAWGKSTLTHRQRREAIKRSDKDDEMLRSNGRSYNVSAETIQRLAP
jgi:hypothetical protein